LLASLGLDQPLFEPKEKRIKISRKRKAVEIAVNEDERPPAKLQRSSSYTPVSSPVPDGGVRRSSRNAGKVIDYSKELADKPLRSAARTIGLENEGPLREGGKRIHNPSVLVTTKAMHVNNKNDQKNIWAYSEY
jgi:E3 ubiquitin-protein ligase UHRF1